MAATDDSSLVPRVLRVTDSESLDFVTSSAQQTSRHVTPEARYKKHDVVADLGGPAKPVIPTPLLVERPDPKNWVRIGTGWTVLHEPKLINEARLLGG